MNRIVTFIKQRKIISAVAIIILIVGGYYWYNKSKSDTAAIQYKTAIAEKGNASYYRFRKRQCDSG